MSSFMCLRLARTLLKALKIQCSYYCAYFFTSLYERNIQGIKYKNFLDFQGLSPYSKDAREMQREQMWANNACFDPRAPSL